MDTVTRRRFLTASGAALGAMALSGVAGCAPSMRGDFAPKSGKRVVVVGGGWGGATAAKYVRLADASIEVILLEPQKQFISCPMSNLVLSDVRTLQSLTISYDGLRGHGVKIIHEEVGAIDAAARRVRVGEGTLEYDRLILSPGIDFQWDQIEGLPEARDVVLHAWKAGPQTVALAKQIQSMADGGVFVLTIPPAVYRCPPGPYERICQVAWYLKNTKPKAKVVVLDANPNLVSKAALFRAAWQAYPNIDYRASNRVTKLDVGARTVTTELGDTVKYDVLNLIPPQRAAAIAVQTDLVAADKRWCEVDHITYESVKAKNIHIIGDSTTGIPVPKSGTVANAMGKIAANAVVSLVNDRPVAQMPPVNVCYSWVNDREAMAVINSYRIEQSKVVQIEQKLTPGQSVAFGQNAVSWAESIWADVLA